MIIKEIFNQSDEELIGSLHFDIRYQYVLHTTDFEKQPVSINTLTNFRNRVIEYEKETGEDLIQQEVESLAKIIAEHMKIDGKKVRMDSLMVSLSCKKLSRLELIYSLDERMVKLLSKLDPDSIPESCKDYLKTENKNEVIYRTRDKETDSKIKTLVSHAVDLYYASEKTEVLESEEYKMLERFFKEQTETGEDGFRIKQGKEIPSNSLQNPTDPYATYRMKYKRNIGYVANVVESFNDEDRIITQYDFKQNTYSDQQFAKDTIKKMPEGDPDNKTKLIVDGTYYTDDNAKKAANKNIELIITQLVGKKPDEDKLECHEFKVDKSKNIIISCPIGEEPYDSYTSNKSYIAHFDRNKCKNYSLKEKCRVKIYEKKATVRISENAYRTSLIRKSMDTKEYRMLGNKRAGIEGIPSVLRKKYRVDSMPVRGLLRSKLWFGFKIAAINFKRLVKWVKKDPVNRSIFDSLLNFLPFHLLDVLDGMIFDIKFVKFRSISLLFVR